MHAHKQDIQREKILPRNMKIISQRHLQYTLTVMFIPKGCFHCFRGLENLYPSFSFSSEYLSCKDHVLFSIQQNDGKLFQGKESYRRGVPRSSTILMHEQNMCSLPNGIIMKAHLLTNLPMTGTTQVD